MLKKLLFQNQDRKQLLIAIAGSFIGITFLVTSVHFLQKVNAFGKGTDMLGPNTIIVQKKVTSSNVLNLAKTDFTEAEIEKISQMDFIHEVKPVVSNNFDISLETADPMVPRFRSDVFVQSVDPEFLDVKSAKWHWKKGDAFVPIIMPRDFLVMLNTFMSAQGIPQVSDELAQDIHFRLTLKNDEHKEWVDARIIGFTNEVSSILVPESFMKYGNEHFSTGEEKKITQIMIQGKENKFGEVEKMLHARGLESKNAQILIGRLKSVVATLILVVLGISVIAVVLSGLVLIQFMQLLMSKNAYEVKTLIRIGFDPDVLVKQFFGYFIRIFGGITLAGFLAFLLVKMLLDHLFESGGLYLETSVSWLAVIVLLLSLVLFAGASYRTAKKGIFRQA